MDPLSIASASASLAVLCVTVSGAIYSWISDTREVDSNLSGLCEEILALSRVFDAINQSWKQNPLILVTQADPNGNLWASVKASLDDCKTTMEKLNRKINSIQKSGIFGQSFLRKPTKQIKLSLNMKDIVAYKQRIQSYNSAMSSALQMINVCLLLHSNSSQESVHKVLDSLKTQIGRVEDALQSRDNSGTAVDVGEDSNRIAKNLQKLVRAAESFHSSASTIAREGPGSTVWGGSILGDPLTPEQFSRIENWIPPRIDEEEENLEDDRSSTAFSSSIPDRLPTDRNPTNLHPGDSDSDSDIESDLNRKFEELALVNWYKRDYAKAEIFFQKVIDNTSAKRRPHEEIAVLKIKLAYTYCFQGKWEDAEKIIVPFTAEKDTTAMPAIDGLHALALQFLNNKDFETSEKYCKRVLRGKKKLLGKEHASYLESINLLALIYRLKGDAAVSEAYYGLLPPGYVCEAHLDPLEYLRKVMPVEAFTAQQSRGEYDKEYEGDMPPVENGLPVASHRLAPSPPKEPLSTPRLILGIDLGNVYTAVAFSYTPAGKKTIQDIITGWPGADDAAQDRVRTVLYYDRDQKVVGWGSNIADACAPNGYPKPGVQKVDWFQLRLLPSETGFVDRNFYLPSLPAGKSVLDVIADYLCKLREAMQTSLHKTLGEAFKHEEGNIRYYFTVPGTWNNDAKEKFRSAVIRAGFLNDDFDDRLTLISEPIVSLQYVSKLGLVSPKMHHTIIVVQGNESLVELYAYKIDDETPLSVLECTAALGDTCGSNELNIAFSKILRAKLRKLKLPEGSRLASQFYAMCIKDFDIRIKNDFRNSGQKWAVDLGVDEDYPEADIDTGFMVFTNEEILGCFEPMLLRILELIRNQITAVQSQDRHLEYIFVTGSMSENEYIFDQIRLQTPSWIRSRVVRPTNGRLTAANAALAADINESGITSRMARRYYLVEFPQIFAKGHHPREYRFMTLDGKFWCRYTHLIIFSRGKEARFGQPIKVSFKKFFGPSDPPIFEDTLYSCDEDTCPAYITDPNIKPLVRIVTDLTKFQRDTHFQKISGYKGKYYVAAYDVFFTPETELVVESVFAGEVVGRVSVDVR